MDKKIAAPLNRKMGKIQLYLIPRTTEEKMFRFTNNQRYKNLKMSCSFTFFFPLTVGRNECHKRTAGHGVDWYILSGKECDKMCPSPQTDYSL